MKCCGYTVETPFCSECGLEMNGDAIIEVKDYIAKLLATTEATQSRCKRSDKANPSIIESVMLYRRRRLVGRAKKIIKLKRWVDALCEQSKDKLVIHSKTA